MQLKMYVARDMEAGVYVAVGCVRCGKYIVQDVSDVLMYVAQDEEYEVSFVLESGRWNRRS